MLHFILPLLVGEMEESLYLIGKNLQRSCEGKRKRYLIDHSPTEDSWTRHQEHKRKEVGREWNRNKISKEKHHLFHLS